MSEDGDQGGEEEEQEHVQILKAPPPSGRGLISLRSRWQSIFFLPPTPSPKNIFMVDGVVGSSSVVWQGHWRPNVGSSLQFIATGVRNLMHVKDLLDSVHEVSRHLVTIRFWS